MAILEMLAARRVVKFIQEIGLHQSHFKDDSKLGVKALQIRDFSFSSFGYLVKNTLFFVGSLRSFPFSHIARQDNAAAHFLA